MPQDLVITPNKGSTTSGAQIAFTGYSGASSIYLKVLPDSSLSFEGSAGQLFSITDNLSSGTIFSVNDITGIPSFDVNANGLVRIAPYGGNVALGTTATSGKLQINTGSATTIGQIIQGASGQSSNYLQTVNVSGLVGATIDSSMNFTRPVSGFSQSEHFGAGSSAAGQLATAVGNSATANQVGATAIGAGATAGNQYSTIVGYNASTSSIGAVGIGWGVNPGQNGVAIGRSVGSSAGGIAIGYGVSTSAYGDIVFNAAGDGYAGPTNFQLWAGTASSNSFYKQHSIYGTWISNVVATRQARVQKYVADFGGDREALRYESNLSYALTSIGGSAVLSGQSLAVTAPAASYTPLTLKGATSQTASLQAWQNSAGSTIASMNASGAILASYGGFGGAIPSGTFKLDVTGLANIGGTTFDGNGGASFPSTSAGGYNTSVTVNNTTKGYGVYVSKNQGGDVDSSISAFFATVTNTYANNPACYIGVSNSPGCKIFIAKGSASQTANLSEWQNSAGTVIASINASGAFNGLLSSGIVTSGSIASGQIGINHLASGVISTAILGSGQVTSGTIASGSVGQFALSSGAVNSGHIGNNAVVSGSIASGQIGIYHLASGAASAAAVAGISGQIQFNAGGILGASSAVTFSSGTAHLNVAAQATNIVPVRITVSSGHSTSAFQVVVSGSLIGAQFDATGVLYCSQYTGAGTNTLINATIPDTTMQRSVIIGQGAYSNSGQIGELVAIGYGAGANHYGVAIGQSTNAGGSAAIAIGLNASTTGAGAVGIGSLTNIAHNYAMGFGSRATSAAAGDIVFATEQQNATIRIQTMSTSPGIVSYLGAIANTWINSTDATKTSRLSFSTYYTTSAQEAFRIDSASDQARTAIGGAILSGSRLSIYTGLSTDRGLVVQGYTSQAANLQEWQNSAATVYARINASGEFFGLLSSGIVVSGSIASGQIGQYHHASGSVTSGHIGNAALVSGSIASGAVGAYHFNSTGLASGYNLRTDGTGVLSWAAAAGGLTVSDDTSTNATRYLAFTSATTGSVSTLNVSSTKLSFNPSTGDFTAGGNITANSDARIKTNVQTISGALQKVIDMRGVYFDRIGTNIKNVGVIAQEIEAIVPELVRESDGMKSVAYGNIVAVLIEAIKEQNKRIEDLEKRLA